MSLIARSLTCSRVTKSYMGISTAMSTSLYNWNTAPSRAKLAAFACYVLDYIDSSIVR